MSLWMSAKVIFVIKGRVSVSEFQRIVGRECDFEDLLSKVMPWDNPELYLPLGSEGTLHIYPQSMSNKKTVYLVSGNLRDKWDVEYIRTWFNRVVRHSKVLRATGETSLDSGAPIKLTYSKRR